MVPLHIRIVRAIDRFTDLTGTLVAWLNVPLVVVVAWEVISRYVFDAPTIWSFDLTYMFYGTVFMLGAAYALHKGAHIRTDFFFEQWSVRTKGLIDSIAYVVFFFPALIVVSRCDVGRGLVRSSRSAKCRSRHPGGRYCGRTRW
jgi:TRAP-type mannitol/chloroaromatic compound transport system permease small subunit